MSATRLEVAIDVSAIPTRPAGAGRYVVDLVGALARRDDVALRLVTRRGDLERWPSGGGTERYPLAPAARPLRLAYGELALSRAVRALSAEVLHGPHYTLPPRTGLPAVVTVHDLTLLEHPEWHERSKVVFFRRALRLASRRADVVVVPSEGVAASFAEHFGLARPVVVVPHGVDHERFSPHEPAPGADGAVLERHRIVWPYVLHVGTAEPRKNLPLLIEAFARVARSRPELRLVLAGGSGWKGDPLEAAIHESGVGERVVRTGYLADEEIPALLRRAAAVAYPSFAEGFGLPALEALAVGAPLVTTAGSAMSEVTADAALLVGADDADALADALAELVEGGAHVDLRRRSGIGRASRYTWAASAAAHREAYALAARRHDGGDGGPSPA